MHSALKNAEGNMKTPTVIAILLLLFMTVGNVEASRVWGGEEYYARLRDEWLASACPSVGYVVALLFSYAVAVCCVARVAAQRGIKIAGPHFIIPCLFFPLFIWLCISGQTAVAEMACDSGEPIPPWCRVVYLLGSTWYGGIIVCGIWMFTHPVFFLRPTARTRWLTMLAYLPCILAPVFILAGITAVALMSIFSFA